MIYDGTIQSRSLLRRVGFKCTLYMKVDNEDGKDHFVEELIFSLLAKRSRNSSKT